VALASIFLHMVKYTNISYIGMHMETPSKRRKIGPSNPEHHYAMTSQVKDDLLDILRFDQIDNHFINIKPRHVNTCKWLLESTEYLDWLNVIYQEDHL